MVWMCSYIEIGDYVFRFVNEVTTDSSWKTLTDTATIKLPNIKGSLEKAIKKGAPVLIRLGYNGDLRDEFHGYVSEISPKIPFEIKCEDEMWQLKQKTFPNKAWRSIQLEDLLRELVPDAVIECPSITLSPFRLNNVTIYRALEILKDEFLLTVYFRDQKLYVGLPYQEQGLGEVNYHFQKNCLFGDLVFKQADDVKIKLKAISMQPDNTKLELELGDPDGELHTLHFYNLKKDELRKLGEEKIKQMKYTGYRGSFTGFGVPKPVHGMKANLMDDRYPERAGSFFIDSVNVTYNSSGFRRKIELGKSAKG